MVVKYGEVYGIYTYKMQNRLDIGFDSLQRNIPADHDSWGTRLEIRRLDGPSKGPVDTNHMIGIFSENGKYRLDLGTNAMKRNVPITQYTWATKLKIKKLEGDEGNGEVHYGDVVGIFSAEKEFRLDIGKNGLKKEIPADHESWATQLKIDSATNPVVEFIVKGITYHTDEAVIEKDGAAVRLLNQTVFNNVDTEQHTELAINTKVEESWGWSYAMGIKVTITEQLSVSIPKVMDQSVTISTEISQEFKINNTITKSLDVTRTVPLTVPPHKHYRVTAEISTPQLSVPFTMDGTLVYADKTRKEGQQNGVFSGMNCDSFVAKYYDLDAEPDKAIIISAK